ncbi:MAG: hypothetical protein WC889_13410, partial [Myxococcota bacterium]
MKISASRLSPAIFCILTPLILGGCMGRGLASDASPAADAGGEAPPAQLQPVVWTGSHAQGWKDFTRLENEQKYEEASALVSKMQEQALASHNGEEWARCMVKQTQLRMALHGYETAVRQLGEQPWPDDLLGNSVVKLYYAFALVNYAGMYSWEIARRERVDSKGPVDLKAWTKDQIYAEALRAMNDVWNQRGQLGDMKVAVLSEYLNPNNYPERIRGTLRDAVTYLMAEQLADSSGWSPEQGNNVYTLRLRDLIDPQPAKTGIGGHPLERIAAITSDLERWHAGYGRTEAAFEARLERLRRLHSAFTAVADRAAIKSELEKCLPALRQREWWAAGMKELAEWTREEQTGDNLVRARKVADDCRKAYPRSVPGQQCDRI